MCGGTNEIWIAEKHHGGLSPRVRGNPALGGILRLNTRSIPACAGEPRPGRHPSVEYAVYPRVCGGTPIPHAGPRRRPGLSPRVRGNHYGPGLGRACRRSIPAPAGEPRRRNRIQGTERVYPRACGGTRRSATVMSYAHGLSPRLRGNHVLENDVLVIVGSIPAPAGEPSRSRRSSSCGGVYPRACGGTDREVTQRFIREGLSPRLRGNPIGTGQTTLYTRSIPAPAGEPASATILTPTW